MLVYHGYTCATGSSDHILRQLQELEDGLCLPDYMGNACGWEGRMNRRVIFVFVKPPVLIRRRERHARRASDCICDACIMQYSTQSKLQARACQELASLRRKRRRLSSGNWLQNSSRSERRAPLQNVASLKHFWSRASKAA